MLLLLNVIDDGFLDDSGNVFSLVFHSVVVLDHSLDRNPFTSTDFLVLSDDTLHGNLLYSLNLVVFDELLFVGNIFNPALRGNFFNDGLLVDGRGHSGGSNEGSTSDAGANEVSATDKACAAYKRTADNSSVDTSSKDWSTNNGGGGGSTSDVGGSNWTAKGA